MPLPLCRIASRALTAVCMERNSVRTPRMSEIRFLVFDEVKLVPRQSSQRSAHSIRLTREESQRFGVVDQLLNRNQQKTPAELTHDADTVSRGSNPRNAHGIRLRPVSELRKSRNVSTTSPSIRSSLIHEPPRIYLVHIPLQLTCTGLCSNLGCSTPYSRSASIQYVLDIFASRAEAKSVVNQPHCWH